jgi:hypothetical protein
VNAQGIQRLYPQFTAQERVHLFLAAAARGDFDELVRLRDTCPRVPVLANDPEYTWLLAGMLQTGMLVHSLWLDVSHSVVRTRDAVAAMHQQVLINEGVERLVRLHPELSDSVNPKELKSLIRQDRALLRRVEAQGKLRSAEWKGTEAAITRFCAERSITITQLFAMAQPFSPVIDEAREDLDADVLADPQVEDGIYQMLCNAVRGPHVYG